MWRSPGLSIRSSDARQSLPQAPARPVHPKIGVFRRLCRGDLPDAARLGHPRLHTTSPLRPELVPQIRIPPNRRAPILGSRREPISQRAEPRGSRHRVVSFRSTRNILALRCVDEARIGNGPPSWRLGRARHRYHDGTAEALAADQETQIRIDFNPPHRACDRSLRELGVADALTPAPTDVAAPTLRC